MQLNQINVLQLEITSDPERESPGLALQHLMNSQGTFYHLRISCQFKLWNISKGTFITDQEIDSGDNRFARLKNARQQNEELLQLQTLEILMEKKWL